MDIIKSNEDPQEIPFNKINQKRKNYTGLIKIRTHSWKPDEEHWLSLSQLNTFYVNALTLSGREDSIRLFPLLPWLSKIIWRDEHFDTWWI